MDFLLLFQYLNFKFLLLSGLHILSTVLYKVKQKKKTKAKCVLTTGKIKMILLFNSSDQELTAQFHYKESKQDKEIFGDFISSYSMIFTLSSID